MCWDQNRFGIVIGLFKSHRQWFCDAVNGVNVWITISKEFLDNANVLTTQRKGQGSILRKLPVGNNVAPCLKRYGTFCYQREILLLNSQLLLPLVLSSPYQFLLQQELVVVVVQH